MRIATLIAALMIAAMPAAPAAANDCQDTMEAMRQLVADLEKFEDRPSFAFYGFAVGGPHHEWIERAEALRDKTSGPALLRSLESDNLAVPADIILWGLEKMRCATRDGKCDREYIKFVEDELRGMKCNER